MSDQQSTGKNYFATLPGLITAVAGLITAVGGLIIILNKAGCMSSKPNEAEQHIVEGDSTEVSDDEEAVQNSSSQDGSFYYTPDSIHHSTRYLIYIIEEATTETRPNGVIILNVKLKCINNSDYEYHFYAAYLGVRVNEETNGPEPISPSGNYVSVHPRSTKALEYNFTLPAFTRKFDLVFYDVDEEIGLSSFTLQ